MHMIQNQTRKKISQALMGHFVSDESKEKNRQSHLGKKHSLAARQKMSIARLGKKMPPFTKEHREKIAQSRRGKIPWNKGKRGLQINPRKGKRNPILTGEKNGSWKGGVTLINIAVRGMPEYAQWRKKVFIRDNYICQKCNYSKGHIIEVDHKIPLAWLIKFYNITNIIEAAQCKELWNIKNGITLCTFCHKKTPTWGKKYNTWLKQYETTTLSRTSAQSYKETVVKGKP